MDKCYNEKARDELYENLLAQLRSDLVEMTISLFRLPLTLEQVAQVVGCTANSLYKKANNGFVEYEVIHGNRVIRLENIVKAYDTYCQHTGRKARRGSNGKTV